MLKERLGLTLDVERLRLRSVLRDIMYLACKYVERSRGYFLKITAKQPLVVCAAVFIRAVIMADVDCQ